MSEPTPEAQALLNELAQRPIGGFWDGTFARALDTFANKRAAANVKSLNTQIIERDATIATLRQERDFAIAHDRQPYPTAQAYELACKRQDTYRQERDEAQKEAATLVQNMDKFLRERDEARADYLRVHKDKCDLLDFIISKGLWGEFKKGVTPPTTDDVERAQEEAWRLMVEMQGCELALCIPSSPCACREQIAAALSGAREQGRAEGARQMRELIEAIQAALVAIDNLHVEDGGKVYWGAVANIASALQRALPESDL